MPVLAEQETEYLYHLVQEKSFAEFYWHCHLIKCAYYENEIDWSISRENQHNSKFGANDGFRLCKFQNFRYASSDTSRGINIKKFLLYSLHRNESKINEIRLILSTFIRVNNEHSNSVSVNAVSKTDRKFLKKTSAPGEAN